MGFSLNLDIIERPVLNIHFLKQFILRPQCNFREKSYICKFIVIVANNDIHYNSLLY